MLNGSTVYSSLDCTSGNHCTALLPEAQWKCAFVMLFGKLYLKKVPYALVHALSHFQQLINEVLQGLLFALRYLDDILVFSENNEKHLEHLRTVFDRLQMLST